MAIPRDQPYIWVSWLPKLLEGSQLCEWRAWFRAHHSIFDRVPDTNDLTAWQMGHTALLKNTSEQFAKEGYAITIEEQNKFTLRGRTGIALAGKPDLIGLKQGSNIIVDVKTGKRDESHVIQVLIYMWLVPLVLPQHKGRTFSGLVVYPDQKIKIASEEVDETFKARTKEIILRIGGNDPCRRVPSARECQYCTIASSECPDRVKFVEKAIVDTDEF
jgi:hypothetical protein